MRARARARALQIFTPFPDPDAVKTAPDVTKIDLCAILWRFRASSARFCVNSHGGVRTRSTAFESVQNMRSKAFERGRRSRGVREAFARRSRGIREAFARRSAKAFGCVQNAFESVRRRSEAFSWVWRKNLL